MLEKELQLERDLFFFLNGSDSAFWDNFFYIFSYKWTWLIFYLCFLWVFIYKKKWKEIICILAAVALLILLSDQISSGIIKPLFHRFRPTHHPDFKYLVDIFRFGNYEYRSGGFGFISSHAANSFGLATFCALIFRNKIFSCTIFLFALITGYSRIYLGVHFISDVIAGAFVGILVGWIIYMIYNWVRHKWLLIESSELKNPIYSIRDTYFICGVFYLCIIVMLIFNNQLITIILQNK